MAKLLGAVFHVDKDLIKTRLGIPFPVRQCLQCRGYIKNRKSFCSSQCQYDYTHIELECPECGQIFRRKQSYVKKRVAKPSINNGKLQKRFYCSRRCFGQYWGRNYGFGTRHGYHRPRKWNWDLVLHIQRETGYGAWRLSRLTGVPISTVSMILRKSRTKEC